MLFSPTLHDWQAWANTLTFSSWCAALFAWRWGCYTFFLLIVACSFTALLQVDRWVNLCWKNRKKTHANKAVSLAISMAFTAGASSELLFRKKSGKERMLDTHEESGSFFTASCQCWGEPKARCLGDLALLLPPVSSKSCIFNAP